MSKLRSAMLISSLVIVSGCTSVAVDTVRMSDYVTQRRADVLTTGRLSASVQETLLKHGIPADDCIAALDTCRQQLVASDETAGDQRLAALAEIAFYDAIRTETQADPLRMIEAWLETVRYAYAYMHFGDRHPGQRALENRQIQVRDYYNFAVQQAAVLLFDTGGNEHQALREGGTRQVGQWSVSLRLPDDLTATRELPSGILPASSLRFSGLRNLYRRDGLGAELVAVMPGAEHGLSRSASNHGHEAPSVFQEMPFTAVTVTMTVQAETLEQVLASREMQIDLFDPYRSDSVEIQGQKMTLSANFTAGYGVWLARSHFSRQSLRTLLGKSDGIARPTVYLMQPYDPERRVIIMLHGLASSPEAWVNLANEIMGDSNLRRRYQIWQLYYPTNLPIVVNHRLIRQAIDASFHHVDPGATSPASRDVTLIGHSMGGVLARLMVSSLKDVNWEARLDREPYTSTQKDILRDELRPYFAFEPLPSVSRVIFIAAPHRGAPFAAGDLGRFAAGLVKLPLTALGQLSQTLTRLQSSGSPSDKAPAIVVPNSIDNLSDHGRFAQLFGDLPIGAGVKYHSIIARSHNKSRLDQSDDGLVPYSSSHLPDADSELIINDSHSVQENPAAILEIRRILDLSS